MSTIKINQFTNDIPAADFKSTGGGQSSWLPEGRHIVKIVEVSEPEPNKYDTSWVDINFEVQAENGKTTRASISVPTNGLHYQTQKGPSLYRAKELLGFCEAAWGDSEFPKDVAVYLRKRFGMPDKTLNGLKLEVEVGHAYGRVYPKKVGGVVKLFKESKPLDGDFPDFDAAEAHAKQQGLKYSKFPKVTKYFSVKKDAQDDDLPI